MTKPRREVARDLGERAGGLAGEQTMRRFVTVDRAAGEIMRSGVTHLDDQPRHHCCGVDEVGGALLIGPRLLGERSVRNEACDECEKEFPHWHVRIDAYCGHADTHWPSIVFCESTVGIPTISALVRTVPV